VLHVALSGFDKVGNQIVAAFQLDVDLRPGIINLIAKANQSIVDANHREDEQNKDYNDNNRYPHSSSPRKMKVVPVLTGAVF
jgi:hypothetical protein